MASEPERSWSLEAISRATYGARLLADGLANLKHAGIVVHAGGADDHYRFQDDVDRDLLARSEPRTGAIRSRVTNTFFACNLETLRVFSSDTKTRR